MIDPPIKSGATPQSWTVQEAYRISAVRAIYDNIFVLEHGPIQG